MVSRNDGVCFAVSTTAFRRKPIEWVIEVAVREGLALEFSSGLPHRPDLEEIFLSARVPRFPHNYFPAPEKPFVLNLGSMDDLIRRRSIEHAKQGLLLAARVGTPFYSAHAGFCLDPDPKELGHQLKLEQRHSREDHWRAFVAATREVCSEAATLKVKFLVENNVVAPFNMMADGSAPLLCARHDELSRLIDEVDSPALGLLLDTGHLKVSAESLGFSADEYVRELKGSVDAFHHSDNDGREDANLPLAKDYWFLRHMPDFRRAWHILEVHDQTVEQIHAQRGLLEEAARGSTE